MNLDSLGPDAWNNLQEIVGYLNFSSGAADPQFLTNLNRLYELLEQSRPSEASPKSSDEPSWKVLGRILGEGVQRARETSEAFHQADQAEAVVARVFDDAFPAYRAFHRDLLFHQSEESLFQPFFIGRMCEAVLCQGPPWDETDRIVSGAIDRLGDFLGHRPVATLETDQKLQPYAHEWVRPIPLYVASAGVASGRYRELIEAALDILRATNPILLHQAWFDPDVLEELAVDPRALDFDHPVNRRPNYHFGQWDPHHIDNKGRYRRFVLQQVTLDCLMYRIDHDGRLDRGELLFEAAAVLAGTMLMGAGLSGAGPDSHDSGATLATLMPGIAAYRDEFYDQLLARLSGAHGERLKSEARQSLQPFAGVRQDLNQLLSRRRAEQLQHVHLAHLYAKMGYTEAAGRQAAEVPVAAARMRCEIECRLSNGHLDIDRGALDDAATKLAEIEDILHRAIECGAMVDPWNILGFGGQYSLFPALENSIYDHRVDELIDLINGQFGFYARLQKEAAAAGRDDLKKRLGDDLKSLAEWWDQFASTEVSEVPGVSGRQAWESASQVAQALGAWHQAGAAGGDIAFWREHVEQFESPKAFALLVEALLERPDLVAAMSLLMYWLSQADEIPLAEGEYSFHLLVMQWMESVWRWDELVPTTEAALSPELDSPWPTARKFLDYLEANADEHWQVPELELAASANTNGSATDELDEEEEDDEDGLFSAAYENVSYRDTTDDGFDAEMLEGQTPATDFELTLEAERISGRLEFLITVCRLWKTAAAASSELGLDDDERDEALGRWLEQAEVNCHRLSELVMVVHRYRIPRPRNTLDAMLEYDQRRSIKETLVERIVATTVEMGDAARFLRASMANPYAADTDLSEREIPIHRALWSLFHADEVGIREVWDDLLESLLQHPLLYIPPSRGGNPQRVLASRSIQRVLDWLLTGLPRLGMLWQTLELLDAIQEMERKHPAGSGAITEFDRLFELGCRGIVQCLVASSEQWPGSGGRKRDRHNRADTFLVECLEKVIEILLHSWLEHSRNIRISVMEAVADNRRWNGLKRFIERYGEYLFTQRFMNFGNLRAILHQGVGTYLTSIEEEPETDEQTRLFEELASDASRQKAVGWLELVIEATVENYAEYVDYNTTTTQSDHGSLLYTLLDCLRLMASYDRIAWNLRPAILAHEVLIRSGRTVAAQTWCRTVGERSAKVAADHLARFEKLSREYGMRLPSVADRLNERFVRPMAIDRFCSLVGPSIKERRKELPNRSFKLLEKEIARFTEEPSGGGFDIPPWLEYLEEEVDRVRFSGLHLDDPLGPAPRIEQICLTPDEVWEQIESWGEE